MTKDDAVLKDLPEERPTRIVIAGSYQQYRDWLRYKNFRPSEYLFIDKPEQLKGLRNVVIHYAGQFQNNKAFRSPEFAEFKSRPGTKEFKR